MATNGPSALHRPAISPDGTLLAVVSLDENLLLISLTDTTNGPPLITRLRLPLSVRNFLQQCHIVRWSPEVIIGDKAEITTTSEGILGHTWLLLSDGKRIIFLGAELKTPNHGSNFDTSTGARANVLAEYDLGQHFGALTLVEFVLDHRHALLMFEHGSNAILLSLTRPERDEISLIKYSDTRSFAQSPDSRRFALLRREKGQDKISTFELSPDSTINSQTFSTHTLDAQGLMWCPGSLPLIAVWDSASYGVKVAFFTPHGHPLRHLDITSASFDSISQPMNVEGVGLTCWKWVKASTDTTIQAAADGHKQVIVRYQHSASMNVQRLASFVHPEVIDGSKTFLWQEQQSLGSDATTSPTFLRQPAAFSATTQEGKNDHDDVQTIEINSNHSIIATVLKHSNKMVWLWQPRRSEPHTVLLFRHPVKNVLWHPTLPDVLVVLTNQKRPMIYAWYQPNLAPLSGTVVLNHETHSNTLVSALLTKFSGTWLPSATHTDGRVPFLLTSGNKFEISLLQSLDDKIVFESLLQRHRGALADDSFGETTDGLDIDTPSKPPGQVIKVRRRDLGVSVETGVDDGIHARAMYGKW